MPTTAIPIPRPQRRPSTADLRGLYARRLYQRSKIDLRARLVVTQQANGGFAIIHGRTVDLSRSGAGVLLTRELPAGTPVVLCLRMPEDSRPLCLGAVIVHRRGYRVGMRFLQPTAGQRLLLGELCHD